MKIVSLLISLRRANIWLFPTLVFHDCLWIIFISIAFILCSLSWDKKKKKYTIRSFSYKEPQPVLNLQNMFRYFQISSSVAGYKFWFRIWNKLEKFVIIRVCYKVRQNYVTKACVEKCFFRSMGNCPVQAEPCVYISFMNWRFTQFYLHNYVHLNISRFPHTCVTPL